MLLAVLCVGAARSRMGWRAVGCWPSAAADAVWTLPRRLSPGVEWECGGFRVRADLPALACVGPVDTGGKGVLDALDKFVPPSCDKAALRIPASSSGRLERHRQLFLCSP